MEHTTATYADFSNDIQWVEFNRDRVETAIGGHDAEPLICLILHNDGEIRVRNMAFRFVDSPAGRLPQSECDFWTMRAAHTRFWDSWCEQWSARLFPVETTPGLKHAHLWCFRFETCFGAVRPVVSVMLLPDSEALLFLVDDYNAAHVNWKVYGGNTFETLRTAGFQRITFSIEDVKSN